MFLATAFLIGCGSTLENAGLGAAGATVVLSGAPGQEIEQIYYLGVFDPREQIPPMIYRVRVKGQASALSRMRFGSGWVPAHVIDSLGTGIGFSETDGRPEIKKAGDDFTSRIETGRRLVLFGPEGFREAPENHRLVIVMGSSPEEWFNAVDRSLGAVSQTIAAQRNQNLARLVLDAMQKAENEERRLEILKADVESDLRLPEED